MQVRPGQLGMALALPDKDTLTEGNYVNGVEGTYHEPSQAEVVNTAVYGPNSSIAGLFDPGAEIDLKYVHTSAGGSLTLPADGTKILTTEDDFGIVGELISGTLTIDYPDKKYVHITQTVGGEQGTLTLPANGNSILSTVDDFGIVGELIEPNYVPDFPNEKYVHESQTVNDIQGTLTLLTNGDNILATESSFGIIGELIVPSYVPDFPAVGNVTTDDTVDNENGTCVLPVETDTRADVGYGADGTEFTGTLVVGAVEASDISITHVDINIRKVN